MTELVDYKIHCLRDVLATDFPAQRWVIPGLLPAGLTLLVAPPKMGKSFFGFSVAVSVATGSDALGLFPVARGNVLLLTLEDTLRRVKTRFSDLLDDPEQLGRFAVGVMPEAPRVGHGLETLIVQYLESTGNVRLIVVDVLARVKPVQLIGANSYDHDYAALVSLKAIADKFNVGMLVIHHTRKATSDDYLERVSGTNGLAGAADAVLYLDRARGDTTAVLHLTGRDVEDREIPLSFDPEFDGWHVSDEEAAREAFEPTKRESGMVRVQRFVDHAPTAVTPLTISQEVGIPSNTVKQYVRRLTQQGKIKNVGHGHYSALNKAPIDDLGN